MDLSPMNKKSPFKIAEKSAEELIPLLYGKISENISTLGAAGIRVPGSAGETMRTGRMWSPVSCYG